MLGGNFVPAARPGRTGRAPPQPFLNRKRWCGGTVEFKLHCLRPLVQGVEKKGTVKAGECFCRMAEPLPALVKNSLEVAWNFLDALGEISDPQNTAEFLLRVADSEGRKAHPYAL